MAREIDLSKQLSEDDIRYLVDRGRWNDLRTNARNLGLPEPNLPNQRDLRAQKPRVGVRARKGEDAYAAIARALQSEPAETLSAEVHEDAPRLPQPEKTDTATDYTKLTVPQLKEELDKRRTEYETDGDTEGVELVSYASDAKKDELVRKLQDDDASVEPDDE